MKFWDKVKTWFSKKLAVTVVGGIVIVVVAQSDVATICVTGLAAFFIWRQSIVDIKEIESRK